MSLGSGVIPWVECPLCKVMTLAISKCERCGLSHAEAYAKVDPSLCLCSARRYEPTDGSKGWNVIHKRRESCPPREDEV